MAIVDKIVDATIAAGIIESKEREIYQSGISLLLFSFLTWGSFMSVGVFLGYGFHCLAYLSFFIPLRMFAGGHHQDSRIKCMLSSVGIFLILFIGASKQFITLFSNVYLLLFIPSVMIIWFLSPVEDLNKPIYPNEAKHHKKTARLILTLESIAIILLFIFQLQTYLYFSLSAITLVAVLLPCGLIKNRSEGLINMNI